MEMARVKKVVLHPAFLMVSPIILAALILLVLKLFGGQYRNMPFLYSYF